MNSSERFNTITRIRKVATDLIKAFDEYRNCVYECRANGILAELTADDFINQHDGLTVADLTEVLTTQYVALSDFMLPADGEAPAAAFYKIKER